MLIEQGTNTGFHPSVAIGLLTADPLFNVTPSGKHHCIFYVSYGRQKNDNGKTETKSILCEAWNTWADNCNCFEKGDNVAVFGMKCADDYRSKKSGQKTFKLVVEFAVCSSTLFGGTNVNNENTGIPESEEQAEEESGFFA